MAQTLQDEAMRDDTVLTAARVTLRAPHLDDAEELFVRVAADPEVTRYLSWSPHPDVAETRRVISEVFNVGNGRTWVIELRATGEPIGLCGWRRPESHSVELGYCLARRWWGRQIMSEVVSVLVDALRRDRTVYRVWGGVPRRQRRIRGRAAALRPVVGGAAGPLRDVPEHQRRATGCTAVRDGAQMTTPRTAQARARSVKPRSGPAPSRRLRNRDRSASRSTSGSAAV